jgi:DNA replication protein DnaC
MKNITLESVIDFKVEPGRETEALTRWKESNKLVEELSKLDLPPRILKDIDVLPFPVIDAVRSSYLCGKVGSGKTMRAVFLMLADLRNGFIRGYTVGARQALFISVPELLLKFKSTYSNPQSDITEEQLIKKYSDVSLLVLDDFGAERTTDWSFQMLYIIINRRYENLKKTIFTSNFTLDQLADKLGDDRLPSRIQQMCEIVLFTGQDYRTVL